MEDYYKEFGIFNDNFIAIYEYNINDKLAIDKNNNLIVQHPYFFRRIYRMLNKHNNVNLINYLEKGINNYGNYLDKICCIDLYNNIQHYQLLQLNHGLLNKLISGLYRLKDYYCTKRLSNSQVYVKNTQDIIEKLAKYYRKIKDIITKNDDDLNLDIYIKK
jgi:hypothetical protein